MDLKQQHNPIASDTRTNKQSGKAELRHYGMPTIFNYGFIPQTWEDGAAGGDNDPIDLVDLSQHKKPVLAVSDYMVLGCLGLIDQGETDWKVLAIDVQEAMDRKINSLADFEKLYPGRVGAVREWFRTYKTLEGKGLNEFIADGIVFGVDRTLEVIYETNVQYRKMLE